MSEDVENNSSFETEKINTLMNRFGIGSQTDETNDKNCSVVQEETTKVTWHYEQDIVADICVCSRYIADVSSFDDIYAVENLSSHLFKMCPTN